MGCREGIRLHDTLKPQGSQTYCYRYFNYFLVGCVNVVVRGAIHSWHGCGHASGGVKHTIKATNNAAFVKRCGNKCGVTNFKAI